MYRILRAIVTFIYKIVYNLKIEGKENIPKEGGYIYASNHRSYADPVLIVISVPVSFSFMAKEELFKNPIFGTFIKWWGAFPVTRGKGDMSAIEESIKRLNKGKNLIIFPEGTRSKDGKVGRVKTGVALVAAQANADIIPVGIVFEGEKLKFRSKLTVKYGKPIRIKEKNFNTEDIVPGQLKMIKSEIQNSLVELVEG